MRKVVIDKKHDQMKIDFVLQDIFKRMPKSAMYKAFRKKDIKVNNVRVKESLILYEGDIVEIYIKDDILDGVKCSAPTESNNDRKPENGLDIAYEDKNIIVVNKAQGISVHPDKEGEDDTLIDIVRRYLAGKVELHRDKGELHSNRSELHRDKGKLQHGKDESQHEIGKFKPALCHRLDRNTGGLVMIAKNQETLNIMLEKIKLGEIKKYYLCVVKGIVTKSQGTMKAYINKDEQNSRVFVSDEPGPNKLTILTAYKVLSYVKGETDNLNLTYLEVELLTGRTHQIRAHFAHIGHPVLGDGKYGINVFNKKFGAKYQTLWAYKIIFNFENAGTLNYLKGKTIEVRHNFKLSKEVFGNL